MKKISTLIVFFFLSFFVFFIGIIKSLLTLIILRKNIFKNKKIFIVQCFEIGSFLASLKANLDFCHQHNINLQETIFVIRQIKFNLSIKSFFSNSINFFENNQIFSILTGSFNFFPSKIFKVPHPNGFVFAEENKINFFFNKYQNDKLNKIFTKLDFDPNKKFVIIGNRSNYYYSSVKHAQNFNNYRNSKFEDLYPLIKYLNTIGIKVVRNGHFDDKELNGLEVLSSMNLSKADKDLFDIFIHLKCVASVVPSSGISWFPCLFNKPTLMYNLVPWASSPSVYKMGIIIPKIIKSCNEDLVVKIQNLLKIYRYRLYKPSHNNFGSVAKVRADFFQSDFDYKYCGIKTESNTPEEILIGYKELEKYYINSHPLTEEMKEMQLRFKSLLPPNHPLRITKAIISPNWLKKYINHLT